MDEAMGGAGWLNQSKHGNATQQATTFSRCGQPALRASLPDKEERGDGSGTGLATGSLATRSLQLLLEL